MDGVICARRSRSATASAPRSQSQHLVGISNEEHAPCPRPRPEQRPFKSPPKKSRDIPAPPASWLALSQTRGGSMYRSALFAITFHHARALLYATLQLALLLIAACGSPGAA